MKVPNRARHRERISTFLGSRLVCRQVMSMMMTRLSCWRTVVVAALE